MTKMKMRKGDLDLRAVMKVARKIWRRDPERARSLMKEDRRFRDFFWYSSVVALIIWRNLDLAFLIPENGTMECLMWTILFIQLYPKKEVMCVLIQVHDSKTYRKSIWSFVEAIADLAEQVVSSLDILLFLMTVISRLIFFNIVFENRFRDDICNDCLITCDETDFQVYEHGRTFYCHKNKKSGLRYEICWPYVYGHCNDINIFKESLVSFLSPGERVETYDGYIGDAPHHIKYPMSCTHPVETRIIQGRVRSRQETVNRRFKCCGILKQVFRHDIPKHAEAMYDVDIIT